MKRRKNTVKITVLPILDTVDDGLDRFVVTKPAGWASKNQIITEDDISEARYYGDTIIILPAPMTQADARVLSDDIMAAAIVCHYFGSL